MNGTTPALLTLTPPLTTHLREQERAVPHLTPEERRARNRRNHGHQIAQRLYPELGDCERCGEPATDRHHIDDNTHNNVRSNLQFLCRHCHMEVDGRLARFESTSVSKRGSQPPKQCQTCGRLVKPLRRGRCHPCNEYLRRHGVERPYVEDGRREALAAEMTRRARK